MDKPDYPDDEARYTYQEFLDKYFPKVGDLTTTCPHCGNRLDESPIKLTQGRKIRYNPISPLLYDSEDDYLIDKSE